MTDAIDTAHRTADVIETGKGTAQLLREHAKNIRDKSEQLAVWAENVATGIERRLDAFRIMVEDHAKFCEDQRAVLEAQYEKLSILEPSAPPQEPVAAPLSLAAITTSHHQQLARIADDIRGGPRGYTCANDAANAATSHIQ